MDQRFDIRFYFVGGYGLVTFSSSDTHKTTTIPVFRRGRNDDQQREQCLLYYYYMTFDNNTSNRNQRMNIYMSTNDGLSNSILIDNITWADMAHNGWQNRTVKVNSSSDSYNVNDSNKYRQIINCFLCLVNVFFQC